MKKLISRLLTLVVIAGTISNTTNCLLPRQQVKEVNDAAKMTRELAAANAAVTSARDKDESADKIANAEENAKKKADHARTWLDSVKGLSSTTKLLMGAIATTGLLIGVDYGIARYTEGKMGGYTAAGLTKASTYAQPYVATARKKMGEGREYVRGSRLNPFNWRKPAPTTIEVPAPVETDDYYSNLSEKAGSYQ